MVEIGDLVGAIGDLRLEGALGMKRGQRDGMLPLAAVLEQALTRLRRQVQAAEIRVALLEQIDDPQALPIVIEAPVVLHQLGQDGFPGVTEGRVA